MKAPKPAKSLGQLRRNSWHVGHTYRSWQRTQTLHTRPLPWSSRPWEEGIIAPSPQMKERGWERVSNVQTLTQPAGGRARACPRDPSGRGASTVSWQCSAWEHCNPQPQAASLRAQDQGHGLIFWNHPHSCQWLCLPWAPQLWIPEGLCHPQPSAARPCGTPPHAPLCPLLPALVCIAAPSPLYATCCPP